MTLLSLFGLTNSEAEEIDFPSPFTPENQTSSGAVINDIIKDEVRASDNKNSVIPRVFLVLTDDFDADGAWCNIRLDDEGDPFAIFDGTVYIKEGERDLVEIPRSSLKIDDDNDLLIKIPERDAPAQKPVSFLDFFIKENVPDPLPQGWHDMKYWFKAGYGWMHCIKGSWVPVAMPWESGWKEDFYGIFDSPDDFAGLFD